MPGKGTITTDGLVVCQQLGLPSPLWGDGDLRRRTGVGVARVASALPLHKLVGPIRISNDLPSTCGLGLRPQRSSDGKGYAPDCKRTNSGSASARAHL